ncbi:hypothetical protein ACR52_10725 [Pseudomonas fildesensis]|jgi:hypothetical protein|uniref:Uncharacterized protein n=1 Tax=Pseudomonas fildesensis TaxID=1674920 RepID=A0A0J8FY23_9PSED|nr:hypothetical protein ACR52_10725 [Pseudomonas fildesensis]
MSFYVNTKNCRSGSEKIATQLSGLLSALDSFAITFTMAAALTLLPLFAVLRLEASRVRALLHPASETHQ